MRVSKTFVAEGYDMETIKSAIKVYGRLVKNAKKLTAGTSHARKVESNSFLVDFQTQVICKQLDKSYEGNISWL